MAKKLTSAKAKEMLHNPPHGKPLTEKQRKFFGAVASGKEPYEKAQLGKRTIPHVDFNRHSGDIVSLPGVRKEIPLSEIELIHNKKMTEQRERDKNAKIVADRKTRIKASEEAKKKPFSAQQIADVSQAIGDKFRLYPEDPNSFVDNYLNPGVFIGDLASKLGRVPLDIQKGNYVGAAANVALPLVTGALGGLNAKNVGQFVDNVFNPLVTPTIGTKQEFLDIVKTLTNRKNANLSNISKEEQELLNSTRLIGHLVNSGNVNESLSILQSLKNRANNINDDYFENLAGFKKSEIDEKIEKLKQNSNKKEQSSQSTLDEQIFSRPRPDPNSFDWTAPTTGQSLSDAISNATSNNDLELVNVLRGIQEREQQRLIVPIEIDPIVNTLDEDYADLYRYNWEDNSPPPLPSHRPFFQSNRGYNRDYLNRYDWDHPKRQMNDFILDKMGDQSLLSRIKNKIDKTEKKVDLPTDVKSLLPSLAKTENNNPAKEVLKAYNTVKSSEKGKSFIPAFSLSSDSYSRLSLPLIERGLKENIIDLNYHGLSPLNSLGFPTQAGVSPELILKEINSKISEINKLTGKKYPFGKIENNTDIYYPKFSVTRKKQGGSIEAYMGGLTDKGFNYNGAWGGQFQMGGNVLPGAMGNMYARHGAPSEGKYAKKTLPSAQNGKEMSFYQQGLDFQPKTISKNGGWLDKYEVPQAQPGTRMASDNTRAPITIKDDTNPETVKSTKSVKAKDNRHWQSDSKAKERINNPNTDFAKNITLDTFIDQIPYSAPILAANAFNKGLPFTALSELVKQPMKVTGDFVMNAIQENPSGYDIKTIEEKIVPFVRLAANATFGNPIISQIGKQVITSGETPNSKWYNRQFNLPTLFEAAKSYNVDDNTFTKFIEDNWESSGKNYKKILELANNKFNKKKKGGKIKKDDMGYWNPDNWGKPVEIGSNVITMDGVYEPLIGVSDTGDVQYMEPGEDYVFDGDSVTEYPVSKNGGWLDKYK
jgi:hypothetical protein